MECSEERKKQLSVDLWIIAIATFLVLGIMVVGWGNGMTEFAYNQSINIVLRVLVIGICGQFGVAGLGITIVCLFRKESFLKYGLNTTKLLPALGLSLLCCVPDFIYCYMNGKVHVWCPFWDWGAFICAIMCILIHGAVGVTPDALMEMFVTIVLIYGMLIVRKETGNAWGCILIFFAYWNAL